MIYWERLNPVLQASFQSPNPYHVLVHRNINPPQRGDTEWTVVRGHQPLWWSGVMQGPQAARVIRENMVQGPSYIVIYGGNGAEVQFVLLRGFNFPENLGIVPPDWWTESPLVGRLLHVNGRITWLREAFRSRPRSSVDRGPDVDGYCPNCGLPEGKHVEHDPPGVDPPGLNQDKVAAWLSALSRHYGQALKQLTDDELIQMPDLNNIRRLRLVAHEIEYRLKKPLLPQDATIPSVWDRLLARDF